MVNSSNVFIAPLVWRFQALEEEWVESDLSSFHRTVREAGKNIQGFRGGKKKEWIQQGKWEDKLNEIREKVKYRYRKKYQDLDREVKGTAKTDKKDYIGNLAEKAEEAASRQDLKTLLSVAKTLKGRYSSGNTGRSIGL